MGIVLKYFLWNLWTKMCKCFLLHCYKWYFWVAITNDHCFCGIVISASYKTSMASKCYTELKNCDDTAAYMLKIVSDLLYNVYKSCYWFRCFFFVFLSLILLTHHRILFYSNWSSNSKWLGSSFIHKAHLSHTTVMLKYGLYLRYAYQ